MSFFKTDTVSPLGQGPAPDDPAVTHDRDAGGGDRRKARATGRTRQFNPKVRPAFLQRFSHAREREEKALGEAVTQAYFLELLLARHERGQGSPIAPFGLSEAALAGAQAIADKMKWDLSQAVEDAIAARCHDLGLGKLKRRR
jgi:hypothetical protein